jgi:hypothetical protein
MPRWTYITLRGEATNTLGHRINNIRVDIPALVKPSERKFQGVEVSHIIGIIQRTEHHLTLDIPELKEISFSGFHVMPAKTWREPIQERLDRRIL